MAILLTTYLIDYLSYGRLFLFLFAIYAITLRAVYAYFWNQIYLQPDTHI